MSEDLFGGLPHRLRPLPVRQVIAVVVRAARRCLPLLKDLPQPEQATATAAVACAGRFAAGDPINAPALESAVPILGAASDRIERSVRSLGSREAILNSEMFGVWLSVQICWSLSSISLLASLEREPRKGYLADLCELQLVNAWMADGSMREAIERDVAVVESLKAERLDPEQADDTRIFLGEPLDPSEDGPLKDLWPT